MTLRDKLAALTAPCPSTDELVAYEAGWTLEEDEGRRAWWVPPGKDVSEDDCKLWPPAYTSSLDATVELVERELTKVVEPEWSLTTAPGGYWACVGHEYSTQSGARHTLPAVAMLLALLDAKGEGVDTRGDNARS